jgi:hypothetical protein
MVAQEQDRGDQEAGEGESTIGAICWIEDIDAWMRSAAATLRSGGRLRARTRPLSAISAVMDRRIRRADSNSAPQRPESWSVRFETARNPSVDAGSRTPDRTAQAIFRVPGLNQAQVERPLKRTRTYPEKRTLD